MNNPPRYGIPQRVFPYASHCELFNAFNPEECLKIKELGELLVFRVGSVGNNQENLEVRDSSIAWINDDPNQENLDERRWLISRMADTFAMVNRDKFQMDLDHFYPMQFTKYGLNQKYNWHVDVNEGLESNEQRKLSAVLFLTGPEEYEGGELELNIGGNPDEPLRLRPPAGTVVFFYAHVPHRVLPVISGERATVVVWGLGPKIR
jgi:PKHD-type hydroxylase